jgi:DNA repair protein RadC
MVDTNLREKYEAFQQFAQANKYNHLLERPLSNWVRGNDRHLPQKFMSLSMLNLSEINFDELLNTSGIGEVKIERLINLTDRMQTQIKNDQKTNELDFTEIFDLPSEVDLNDSADSQYSDPDEIRWEKARAFATRNRIANQKVGSVAVSLQEIQNSFWDKPLSDFTDLTYTELQSMPGFGEKKISAIANLIEGIELRLKGVQSIDEISITIMRAEVEQILNWVKISLASKDYPSTEDIRENVLTPLLSLIRNDLNDSVAQVIELRIGMDKPPQTLYEIGLVLGGISRERVRQLENNARNVLQVRWSEGGIYLGALSRHWSIMSGCESQQQLLSSISKVCFDSTIESHQSDQDWFSKWKIAGKKYLTPLNEEVFCAWLNKISPDFPATQALNSLIEKGLSVTSLTNDTLFFSDSVNDRILRILIENRGSTDIETILKQLSISPIELNKRLQSDPRVILDDRKCPHTVDYIGMSKHKTQYHLKLFQLHDVETYPVSEFINIDQLVDIVLTRLTSKGIFDATVWGVHRFITESIRDQFNASISNNISAFMLSSLLIKFSNGKIRPMRRRRLRWNDFNESQSALGKTGWINYIVKNECKPLTLEELDVLLNRYYQDYKFYVIQQLPKYQGENDEGVTNQEYHFFDGIPRVIPPIIIPNNWVPSQSNHTWSDGVNVVSNMVSSLPQDSDAFVKAQAEIPWIINKPIKPIGMTEVSDTQTEVVLEIDEPFDKKNTTNKTGWLRRLWRN